jgi:riboflavin biosynthesis pyrimidine reductase
MLWLKPVGEVDDPLAPYLVPRGAHHDRPYVLANMVSGLDGRAAVTGRVGVLSTPADARLFLELRSVADIVLVGAHTVRQERYGPVRLADHLRDARLRGGRPATPRIAVVTRTLDFDWSIPLFSSAAPESRPLLITSEAVAPDRIREAQMHADVVVAGRVSVDLREALGRLKDDGAAVVLCEGGPTLLGALAAGDLLDELCLTVTPVMGGDPLPLSLVPSGTSLAWFSLAHVLSDESSLFLRYERSAER